MPNLFIDLAATFSASFRRRPGPAKLLVASLWIALAAPADAQSQSSSPPFPVPADPDAGPIYSRAPHGESILLNRAQCARANSAGYAIARRDGDTLYVSGVIAGPRQGQTVGPAEFGEEVRDAFRRIGRTLEAAGASFSDVVVINSFHRWSSPNFNGSLEEHQRAFRSAKNEFLHAPFPAWTAVGTPSLVSQSGLVEIQVIAHLPKDASRRTSKLRQRKVSCPDSSPTSQQTGK